MRNLKDLRVSIHPYFYECVNDIKFTTLYTLSVLIVCAGIGAYIA